VKQFRGKNTLIVEKSLDAVKQRRENGKIQNKIQKLVEKTKKHEPTKSFCIYGWWDNFTFSFVILLFNF